MRNWNELEDLVLNWAWDRGILRNGTAESQALKLASEVGELLDEIAKQNHEKAKLEMGDVLVVCIILSELLNIDIISALNAAYNKIKDRKGYLNEAGVFVKEETDATT